MKLTPDEMVKIRKLGLYITEKRDGCGKVLNQSVRYTITGKPEVHCSALCRDEAFFGPKGLTRAAQGRSCIHCHKPKSRSDSSYCLRCQPEANRCEEKAPDSAACSVCGTPIPSLRAARTETCSSRCKETLKKRHQRKRTFREQPEELILAS